LPKEPANFDCRDAGQVLRLRLRDWLWPAAIPILGQSNGPHRIGSVTFYAMACPPRTSPVAELVSADLGAFKGHSNGRQEQALHG